MEYRITSVRARNGGGVVVTNVNWSEVFCNDLETGRMLWSAKPKGWGAFAGCDPFIRDGKVIEQAADGTERIIEEVKS